jgi:hypothetical protein
MERRAKIFGIRFQPKKGFVSLRLCVKAFDSLGALGAFVANSF